MPPAKIQMPGVLVGRCSNGYERGKGRVVHSVTCDERAPQHGIESYAKALCGVTHGARSAGWSARPDLDVTCPKCMRLICA